MAIDPRAKFLRKNATHTERLLWAQLRKKRVGNVRFRRQYIIGTFVVDFVCLPARLIVEIDGASHDQTIQRDEKRAAWLRSQGFEIIRFANSDVLSDLDGVIQTIANAIVRPSPNPLPQGEGGFVRSTSTQTKSSE